ncbi:integrase core domain-containing protein [Cellulomonas sp. URHB0016]
MGQDVLAFAGPRPSALIVADFVEVPTPGLLVRRSDPEGVGRKAAKGRTSRRVPPLANRVLPIVRDLADGRAADELLLTTAQGRSRTGLDAEGLHVPAISTIRRVITTAGLVTPEPRKRPRSSLRRFAAEQPNETWQSDFRHWPLADGTDTEILNWLDDHSRYLLSCTAHPRVTGTLVVDSLTTCINTYGPPASTLTDNGSVYTSRFTGGRNAFEYLLHALGIQQKNGHPNHPQTQGKIERFHATLKRWLAQQPPAPDLPALQTQLDTFRELYNTAQPHRALDHATPHTAYHARPRARAAGTTIAGHYRLRFDHVGTNGKISLRRAGRMHHLAVGAAHRGTPVLILIDETTTTIIARTTGDILASNTIDPTRTYWRNNEREPGRGRALLYER